MSNIDDLDRLVTVFMKQEDEHFSLFNYIQTVNQETDQHLEKTEELEVTTISSIVDKRDQMRVYGFCLRLVTRRYLSRGNMAIRPNVRPCSNEE